MNKKRKATSLKSISKSSNLDDLSNINSNNKNSINQKESNVPFDLETIFKKNIKSRNINDFDSVKQYLLNHTNIKEEFKSDYLTLMYSFDQFFKVLYTYFDFSYYSKGEKIYLIGDVQDYVYLKIKGNVGKYKIISEERSMTGLEYYLTLKNLFEEGNTMLFEQTKEANIKIYPVNLIQDLLNIEEIFFNLKLNLLVERKDDNAIISLLKENNKNATDVGYDAVQNGGYTFEQYYQYRSNMFPEKNSIYYNHINQNKHNVTIFKYSLISLIVSLDILFFKFSISLILSF